MSDNSGKLWLDALPEDWLIAPAWSVFKERGEKSSPTDAHLTPSQQYGVLTQQEYMSITGSRVVLNLTGADNMKAVRAGDFVIHLRSFQGGIEFSSIDGKVSNAYTVLEPVSEIDFNYFRHLFKSEILIEQLTYLTDQLRDGQNISYSRFARMVLPLPPLQTQRRIADYLDRETSQIDAMLGKLGDVTDELMERRAVVIQRHTINAGGKLTKLKFCAEVSLGKTFQGVQKRCFERFVNYVRAASIQTHGLELDDQRMWMSDAELDKYNLLAGDVLIVEGGAGYGRSVVLPTAMPGWGFQNHVIRARPNKNSDGRFLNYCVKAHLDAGLIDILVDGATIPALSSDKARELPVLAAPLDEQRRIADHLDDVTSKIDTMLAKVAELKGLLTERRAALITDVVTGRKDVA